MLISESISSFPRRPQMILINAMSLILFSLCCFCLCHSAISSTIQEDIDKFLRNDLLLYISKDGIESADRTNLAGHHQLDQFQDFSVLRQPFSSSSLVYDDNIKEESTSRLASTAPKSNSLLKMNNLRMSNKHLAGIPSVTSISREQVKQDGPVGAHSKRPDWQRSAPSVAVGVSFGLRTKPLLRSMGSPPVGIAITTTARPFLLKTNNERSVKPISTTTTVPVTEETVGPVDLDYLDNSEDEQRSPPIEQANNRSNRFDWDNLWVEESQQSPSITRVNDSSEKEDGTLGLNLPKYNSKTVNYSTLFGEYKSPSLSFDPFKLYDEQVGQKNAGENVIADQPMPVKLTRIVTETRLGDTQHLATYHSTPNAGLPPSAAPPSRGNYQLESSSLLSPNIGSTGRVVGVDRDRPALSISDGLQAKSPTLSTSGKKVNTDSTSWNDRSSLPTSVNPNPTGHHANSPQDATNLSAYDRNAAYEYMKSLFESPGGEAPDDTDFFGVYDHIGPPPPNTTPRPPSIRPTSSSRNRKLKHGKNKSNKINNKLKNNDKPPLNSKHSSSNSISSQPFFSNNGNSIGNFGNRLNTDRQFRPEKPNINNYASDYKLSDDFYLPKPIPDRYLSKPFRGFANQINKPAASYEKSALPTEATGDVNRWPPTSTSRPSIPLGTSSKWRGIPTYTTRRPKSSHDGNFTTVKPIVTSIIGRNQSGEVMRLIPQASVETVPLPPFSEYDQPEVIHAGDYVVRVEKVPVKNLQDAYYNPEIPGESIANSSVSSASLQNSDDSSTESNSSDNEVDGDDKNKEEKNSDEDKKTEDSSDDESEGEREDTTTTSTTEKPESDESSSEDTEEDKESNGDNTGSQEDDNTSGEDNDSGSSNDDKDEESESGTSTTTEAPTTTTTTTPKPSPPPYPPYPMFPPPFMFPPMYPPMPPPPMYGNGAYPPPIPPMPYPMPPPLPYMPYGPHIYRPNYGPQAKPQTAPSAYRPNPPYGSSYPSPGPAAAAPVPPQQPYPAAPPPNKPYYPNPNSINYTPVNPHMPSSGVSPHYKPSPPPPMRLNYYPQQKYPRQPYPPVTYPQKPNYPPNNYQHQYTNEITKTISISSESPKNEYYQYYRRDDSNQYPPTSQGTSSYQQPNSNPNQYEQGSQYQTNPNLPNPDLYPAVYQEPNQHSVQQEQYGNTLSGKSGGNTQNYNSQNYNLNPQALSPINYATQTNYGSLTPEGNQMTYPSQQSPLNQVNTQYSQPNIHSTAQPYANSQQGKQSKFSLENIKKGLKRMLPKLRYSSGDPYPPELDVYYRPLTGTFDPNDPMEDFWNHIDKENQEKPAMYNCDQNRVGKCVMPGISPSQPFPPRQPLQHQLPLNPVNFQSSHVESQSFQSNQAFHNAQSVNQQFNANQAAVQPMNLSQLPMSESLQFKPLMHNQFSQTQSQPFLQQQSAALASPTLVSPVK